jgi:hypothetical protein
MLTRALIDGERSVPHAEPRMAALLDVLLRTTETVDQKAAQPLLGGGQVATAIQRPKNFIVRDLAVESGGQTLESLLTDGGVNFVFFHCR